MVEKCANPECCKAFECGKGDYIVALSNCCMAAHLRIAMVLSTVGFVGRARKPTLANLAPGSVL
jgi:hypothetical protein